MPPASERPSDAQLTQMYNAKRQELQATTSQISELESEAAEHKLVLESLAKAQEKDPDRRCFRLVGGVLVERTVAEVVPQLQTNLDGITKLIEQTAVSYQKKEQEFRSFIKENNIQVQGAA